MTILIWKIFTMRIIITNNHTALFQMKNHPMVLVTKTDSSKAVKNTRASGEEHLTLSAILFSLWILFDLMIIIIPMCTPSSTPNKFSGLFREVNDKNIAQKSRENKEIYITRGGAPEHILNEKSRGIGILNINTEEYENKGIRFHHVCLNKTLILERKIRSRIFNYILNIRGFRKICSTFRILSAIIRWLGKLIYKIGVKASIIIYDILDIMINVGKFCIMAVKIIFFAIKIIIKALRLISKIGI